MKRFKEVICTIGDYFLIDENYYTIENISIEDKEDFDKAVEILGLPKEQILKYYVEDELKPAFNTFITRN